MSRFYRNRAGLPDLYPRPACCMLRRLSHTICRFLFLLLHWRQVFLTIWWFLPLFNLSVRFFYFSSNRKPLEVKRKKKNPFLLVFRLFFFFFSWGKRNLAKAFWWLTVKRKGSGWVKKHPGFLGPQQAIFLFFTFPFG